MKHLSRETIDRLTTLQAMGDYEGFASLLRSLPVEAVAELKALLWLARDGESPRHWDALVIEARSKVDLKTAGLFAEDPQLANSLTEGLEMLEAAGRI